MCSQPLLTCSFLVLQLSSGRGCCCGRMCACEPACVDGRNCKNIPEKESLLNRELQSKFNLSHIVR
uniref:Uncharacterized protein n=1 Tax=Rhizophora mucronata TaxID=61149 RepID=A0A2P2QMB1_RHIMU